MNGKISRHLFSSLSIEPAPDEVWQEQALCREVDTGDLFYPDKGQSTREVKKICMGCEVRSDCLEYAIEHDERFGVWGGLSERERRNIRSNRRADAETLQAEPSGDFDEAAA